MPSIASRSIARRADRQRKAARREFLSCAAVVVGMMFALPAVVGLADIMSTGMGNKSIITTMLESR